MELIAESCENEQVRWRWRQREPVIHFTLHGVSAVSVLLSRDHFSGWFGKSVKSRRQISWSRKRKCPWGEVYGGATPKANSACHPSWVGKWIQASAGKVKAGMVHFVSGWTRGVQVKLWDPLRTRTIPERLRGVITTRRYTNPRLHLSFTTIWDPFHYNGALSLTWGAPLLRFRSGLRRLWENAKSRTAKFHIS